MTDAAARAREQVASAAAELRSVGAPTETLAEYRPPRRVLLIPRPATFADLGRVWRLGVLLVADDGALFATGAVTRARDPRHPNYTSVSGEQRREVREAAARAGFGPHDTVDFDAPPLPFDNTLGTVGPLVLRGGELLVSWNGTRDSASLRPFEDYLRERVDLLVNPPAGAGESDR